MHGLVVLLRGMKGDRVSEGENHYEGERGIMKGEIGGANERGPIDQRKM